MKLDYTKQLSENRNKRIKKKLENVILGIAVFGLILTILYLAGGH